FSGVRNADACGPVGAAAKLPRDTPDTHPRLASRGPAPIIEDARFRGRCMVTVCRCPRGHTWAPVPADNPATAPTCPVCGDTAELPTDTPQPFVVPVHAAAEAGGLTDLHLPVIRPPDPSFSDLVGLPVVSDDPNAPFAPTV